MPLLFKISTRHLKTVIIVLSLINWYTMTAQIGIGVPAGESPEAALDVRFDSAISPGFLMPRVTALPTGDIANGMLVFYCAACTDTDDDGNINYEEGIFYVYTDHDGDGDLEWTTLAESSGITPPDTQAPSVPNNLIASGPTMTSIDLSWDVSSDNIGVSGYKIYFSDGTLAESGISGTSTTITDLSLETFYTFYVTAYDAAGNESSAGTNGDTNWATESTTGDTEIPTTPTLTASGETSSSIDLSWSSSTDNIGVAGYYVYQDGVQVGDVTSGTSTTISGLAENTQYSFYVRAYDAAGNLSGQSNTVTPSTTGGCVQTTFCEHDFENNDFGCWNRDNGASISGGRSNKYVKLEGEQNENIYSGVYDFTGFSRVKISFLAETNSKWDNDDEYILEVKIGNGNYQQLQSWGETENWTTRVYNITQNSYLTQNISVRIRNLADDDKENVYIDDASIIGYCN